MILVSSSEAVRKMIGTLETCRTRLQNSKPVPSGRDTSSTNKSYLPSAHNASASDEEMNIIMGLDIGGDDYITKPFKLGVLISRINALLRRAKDFSAADTELQSNGIRVLLLQGQTFKNGELLDLTAAEYKLLCLFMQNPNVVLTKEQILDKLWDCPQPSFAASAYIR